jgi:heme o synthase
MSQQNLTRFRGLALATTISTLVLTGIGGLVRATNSGLGCHDEWPKCIDGWIAPAQYHAIIEFSHRAAAFVVVILIAALVVASFRWVSDDRTLRRLSLASLGAVIAQALVGAIVVKVDLHAAVVTAHFVVALALVGLTTLTTATAFTRGRPPATGVQAKVRRTSIGALAAVFVVLLIGTYVREQGAGVVFADWPLMGGRVIPSFAGHGHVIQFLHRLLALLVLGHLLMTWMRARKDARRDVRTLATAGLVLYLAQAGAGAANVLTRLEPAAVLAHATLAFVLWSAYVALAVVAGRARPASDEGPSLPSPGRVPGFAGRINAYVRLTKPRIIVLLLVTTVPAMVLAQRGFPPLWLIGATLLGGMMTAGSANALNQFLERDIDSKMRRTSSRPLPTHSVEPTKALVFAIALGIAGFVWLTLIVNLLSAVLAVAAILFYVLVYTLLLKRSTPQNIVIGGAAGAVPVLVGWAAVTGTVGAPAWVMFMIIFLWTPPHFWALAMRYREDYAAAGVPMMPVVRSDAQTTQQILLYAIVLVFVTLVLSPVGGLGVLYALAAALLGGGFIYRAAQLRHRPDPQTAFGLFKYSVTYLGLLFAAIAVDRLFW